MIQEKKTPDICILSHKEHNKCTVMSKSTEGCCAFPLEPRQKMQLQDWNYSSLLCRQSGKGLVVQSDPKSMIMAITDSSIYD